MKKLKGFTLIELMIVFAIIMIIGSILVPAIQGKTGKKAEEQGVGPTAPQAVETR